MDLTTVIGIITGGALTGFITFIFTLRYVKNQEKGKGIQEVAKGKQEEIKALESMDSVLDRISARVDKEVQKYQETISKQEVIIEKQTIEIKELKKIVSNSQDKLQKATETLNNYIKQCETCPNNTLGK